MKNSILTLYKKDFFLLKIIICIFNIFFQDFYFLIYICKILLIIKIVINYN